jgi:hypothetical protein
MEVAMNRTGAHVEGAVQRYLDQISRRRDEVYSSLRDLPEEVIWRRPAPKEWSVGENLDHARVIYSRWLPWFQAFYALLQPWAMLRRDRPYAVEIDDVYRRPNFPQNVGWMWPPHNTPEHPAALDELYENTSRNHHRITEFYLARPEPLLGHVVVYDPAIGLLNLIQALQVGLYHDELHYESIRHILAVSPS